MYRKFVYAFFIFFILSFPFALYASENEEAAHDSHSEAAGEGHSLNFFIGPKFSYIGAFAEGETHHYGGGGLFFEAVAVPRWLEIEVAARVMANAHVITLPIDVLLKIPFHMTHAIHPFIGIGPTAIPTFPEHEDAEIFFGGVLAVGSYFWFSPHWAWIIEFNYNLVYEHGIANELGVNTGFAYGF